MINCPNINHQDWKDIVEKYGEDTAWASYIAWEENIPSLREVDNLMEVTDPTPINDIVSKRARDFSRQEAKDKEILGAVNTAIGKQLEAMGVGIGVLQEFQDVKGVFDPQGAKNAATGLVELIKVAKGERGQKAIPEEYAHLVDTILKQQGSPIFDRLTNLLSTPDIIEQVFEREEQGSYEAYMALHKGDMDMMAAEARGKLIARHIIKNEEISKSPWANLMNRVKTLFNRVFSKGNETQLFQELYEADKEYSKFTAQLLGGEIQLTFNLDNIRNERLLYNIETGLKNASDALDDIITLRARQLHLNKDSMTQADIKTEENFITNLTYRNQVGDTQKGILVGLEKAVEEIQAIRNDTIDLKTDANTSTEVIAKTATHLRKLKGYHSAYAPFIESVNDYLVSPEFQNDPIPELETAVNNLSIMLDRVNAEYMRNAAPLFKEFIKRFRGSLVGSVVKGEVFTELMFDRLLIEADKDIGFAEKYLFSMSNSSDLMLRLIEQPIKEAQWKKRQEINEISKNLMKLQENLEANGHKTDFMHELDADGKTTHYWVTPTDVSGYEAALTDLEDSLTAEYGHPVKGNPKAHLWFKTRDAWIKENTDDEGNPKASKFPSKQYNSWDASQKEFYNAIIAYKKELMSYLPENKQDLYLAPQYRKDFMEVIKDSRNITEGLQRFKTLTGDQFIDRESDDMYGVRETVKGFDGREIERLPVYYTNKLDDAGQLSTDVVSSMLIYADMAVGYRNMNEIVDIMEIGRDMMRDRKIGETRGGRKIMDTIKNAGRTISSKAHKEQGVSNFLERLDGFYSQAIYGVTQKDEGSFKIPFTNTRISYAKLASQLNKYTAMNTYAFNLLGGVANVITGKHMTRIEAMAGEFIGVKESAKADRVYAKWLPDIIGDLGRRRDRSLPSLLMEKFNVHQDYENSIRALEANKKNLLSRYVNTGSAFFINNAGEHYLAAKLFIGMSERVNLLDGQGNQIKLIEAFEVVQDSKGIERLQLKQGVTKLDGSEYTDKDMMAFSRKYAKVHQNLHGIYNREDMSMWQTTAIGKMAFMFRKWMPPAFSRRFSGENFDFDLGQSYEGYYRTTGNFLKAIYNDLRGLQTAGPAAWADLNAHERSNVIRALTEVGTLFATIGAYMLLSNAWDDDDEWWKTFTLYQIRRQQTEIGTVTPLIYTQFKEGFTILQSPAAAMDYSQHLLNVLRVWDLWREPLQSGQYKGWNRYARNVVRPLPYHNAIRRSFNPEESLKFLNNN